MGAQGQLGLASGFVHSTFNLVEFTYHASLNGTWPRATSTWLQGEEEEAEPEKPAKKQVREEDVFAGNKNLRSEDQKFREMHDDRQVPLSQFSAPHTWDTTQHSVAMEGLLYGVT